MRTWAPPAGVIYTGTYNPFNDCDLFNPPPTPNVPGQIQCGAISNPAFGQATARTTNYDPSVVSGWHVRPNNWEGQVSIQREIVPRVSVYAAYTRRWFGNCTATRNQAVTNADFTPYCVPVPADSRLENGGGTAMRAVRHQRVITPNNLIFNSSNIGGIDDVYDGFDFDVNARLARGIILSGGVSVGRERDQQLQPEGRSAVCRQTRIRRFTIAHGPALLRHAAAVPAAVEGTGDIPAAVVGHQCRRRSRACRGRSCAPTIR